MGEPQTYDDWLKEHGLMVSLSNRVQRWSLRRGNKAYRETGKSDGGNFGEAARALKVTVAEVAAAVEWHPWMLTLDTDAPLPIRRIEHDGE